MTLTTPYLTTSSGLAIVSGGNAALSNELKALCKLRKRALGDGAEPDDITLFDAKYEIHKKGTNVEITGRAVILMEVEMGKMPSEILAAGGDALAFVNGDFKGLDGFLKIHDKPEEIISLSLVGGRFYRVPQSILDFKALKKLDLSNNALTGLSSALVQLIWLTELNIYNNELSKLPDWLVRVVNLKKIDCRKNRLDTEVAVELLAKTKIPVDGITFVPQK